jgi:NAD(P)-dependent dehydrogenase (short-subunit alcohol dehydrogenase family)
MDIRDKVVLITGASGALGEGVIKKFAANGARLVLVDRKSEPAPGSLDGLDDALFIGDTDVTDPDSAKRAVDIAIAQRGRIDVLINIAGGYRGGKPVHETPVDQFDFVINLNARTVFVMSSAVIPHMIAQGSGKIISIAAKGALKGTANSALQAASKSAVIRLTESMSEEVKHQGINVNCILPSTIDTQANRDSMPNADFNTWVTADAIADVIAFLSSEESRGIHGAAIPVFGRA